MRATVAQILEGPLPTPTRMTEDDQILRGSRIKVPRNSFTRYRVHHAFSTTGRASASSPIFVTLWCTFMPSDAEPPTSARLLIWGADVFGSPLPRPSLSECCPTLFISLCDGKITEKVVGSFGSSFQGWLAFCPFDKNRFWTHSPMERPQVSNFWPHAVGSTATDQSLTSKDNNQYGSGSLGPIFGDISICTVTQKVIIKWGSFLWVHGFYGFLCPPPPHPNCMARPVAQGFGPMLVPFDSEQI